MKGKNVMTFEEMKPDYSADAFSETVPEFTFSVSGSQVVIRVRTIVGADGYEVYQRPKAGRQW